MSRHINNTEMEDEISEDTPLLNDKHKVEVKDGRCSWFRRVKPYSLYVLLIMLLAYLFNQLDRYMLAITAQPMAQEIHFGDKGCVKNDSVTAHGKDLKCNATVADSCIDTEDINGTRFCRWDYNGQGWDYQIVAGPVFILVYTFAGIFIGFLAENYNRKLILSVCLIFWSVMTLLTGFIHNYWQLVVLRFGLGLGEAGCTPFVASLLSDYFTEETRGTAFGIYNFGIYFGYGLSYTVGNFITLADINGQGWRWSFILPAIPGVLIGLLIILTVKEPERSKSTDASVAKTDSTENDLLKTSALARLKLALRSFMSPSLLLLCFAGSIRNAGGYVWAYNTQPYFEAAKVSKETIGSFMSWIPMVGGSLGVLWGGFISDRLIKNRGLYARIFVLVGSQFLAAPFAAGALFLDSPYSFISLIPSNIFGEMWIGVCLAVAVEFVPSQVRTTAVAVYLFIITNIGGNIQLLVPPIQKAFENDGYTKVDALRGALYILFPGLYLAGGFLFLLTLFVVKRDQRLTKEKESSQEQSENGESKDGY